MGYTNIDDDKKNVNRLSFPDLTLCSSFHHLDPGEPAYFSIMKGQNWLDGNQYLKIAIILLGNKTTVWDVNEDESGSDQKYIKFQLQYCDASFKRYSVEMKHRKNTKYEKLKNHIRNKYVKDLKRITDIE